MDFVTFFPAGKSILANLSEVSKIANFLGKQKNSHARQKLTVRLLSSTNPICVSGHTDVQELISFCPFGSSQESPRPRLVSPQAVIKLSLP